MDFRQLILEPDCPAILSYRIAVSVNSAPQHPSDVATILRAVEQGPCGLKIL